MRENYFDELEYVEMENIDGGGVFGVLGGVCTTIAGIGGVAGGIASANVGAVIAGGVAVVGGISTISENVK